jgi:integrin beta 8
MQGDIGEIGIIGRRGEKGDQGIEGRRGVNGRNGYRGPKGYRGDAAPPPPPPKSRGFIFTVHSQSVEIPQCPVNTVSLWDGYSLASLIAGGRAVGQDLGIGGSCLRRFTTMPYMLCDLNSVCNYAQNNDDSMWLATSESMPMSMAPIPSKEIEKYISRCSVCETTTRVLAVHSQSMDIPDCPRGWEEMWTGFSYVMLTTDNTGGFGQDLLSPGSCLKEFRPMPIIECQGHGRCNFYDTLTSFWLTVIDDRNQFRTPVQSTIKKDHSASVSRCAVCRKSHSSYSPSPIDPLPGAEALLTPRVEVRTTRRPVYRRYQNRNLPNTRRFDGK